ncbi:MAG: arginine--tRNA ligase [Bacteroidota bacterium]
MSVTNKIKLAAAQVIKDSFGVTIDETLVLVNRTKPEFEGDYTVVLFGFIKQLKKGPDEIGKELGEKLLTAHPHLFTSYNIIKGFLNLTVTDDFYLSYLAEASSAQSLLAFEKGKKVMVEYSSPNTNKPLHLGHLRNNFLGWSVAQILKETGNEVMKTAIINDRGVHICKSMIAWQKFGNGATPESTGKKGDHFVGDYYVQFNDEYKKQTTELLATGQTKEDAERNAPIMKETQQMLVDWEAGKPDVMKLWRTMNSWVYAGFDTTYKRIGSDFDKNYYESQTYLLGKKMVDIGLSKNVFYKKDDGSVWINLTDEGLDEKLVMRRDGTSVYITQDIGLADQKHEEFAYDESIYVIGDEQNYHMKVLQLILKKLGMPYADGIHHLSYGMVELPTGRMKSREGTVVDADDLVEEMVQQAREKTREKSRVDEFTDDELTQLYETIALGALKFFLLKVDPKKKMVFNPEESIDFHGFTGPFIQYTHARLKSILRKAGDENLQSLVQSPKSSVQSASFGTKLLPLEKELLLLLEQFNFVVHDAAKEFNPSTIANYIYAVAKTCNSFYTEHKVLTAESEDKKQLRLQLCKLTAGTIKEGMALLGIKVPERM